MVSGNRNIKNEYNVAVTKEIDAIVNLPEDAGSLAEALLLHREYFSKLARVTDLTVGSAIEKPKASASYVVGRTEVYVPLAGMIDLAVERERLRKEIDQKQDFLGGVQRKLRNEQFTSKAPGEVVERERKKERDALEELERLKANLDELG
jgi:valyl-tRNA synthetase